MQNPDMKANPRTKTYKFKVRNEVFESEKQFITGREVLEAAGLIPPSAYKLDLRLKGNRYQEVGLEQAVDLGNPGIEKFTYISRDQSEG